MATAKRERVVQTTHPSISSGNSNIQGIKGNGSPRRGGKIAKGDTPDSPVIKNPRSRSYSAIVDQVNQGLTPVTPKGAKAGRRN